MRLLRDDEPKVIAALRLKHGIRPLAEIEREMVSKAYVAAQFNESLAAKLVGMARNTFVKRLDKPMKKEASHVD